MPDDIEIIGILRAHRIALAALLAMRTDKTKPNDIEDLRQYLTIKAIWEPDDVRSGQPGVAPATGTEIDAIIDAARRLLQLPD